MKDYMTIYKEWLENPYFDEATKEELDVYKRQVVRQSGVRG